MKKREGRTPVEIGESSGRLVVLALHPRGAPYYGSDMDCRCAGCGEVVTVSSTVFRRRFSCKECSAKRGAEKRTVHGASTRKGRDPLYTAYQGLMSRCYNPNTRAFRWYGAKGITVCEEWHDFATYRVWALANGWKPGLTLDRFEENLGYSPSNCQYATKSQNAKSMRAKYRFVLKSMMASSPYDDPCYGDY